MKKRTIDTARLARAVHLDVRREDANTWLVTGGTAPHYVTRIGGRYHCDCLDRQLRGGGCKHTLRVLLALGHPATIRALRDIVPEPDTNR